MKMRVKARSFWIGLLLVMVALRALVPTGFMPDTDTLAAGRFALAICDGHQAIPFVTHAAELHAEHDLLQALAPSRRDDATRTPFSPLSSSTTASEHGEICPFSAVLCLAVAAFIAIALLRVLSQVCWSCPGDIACRCLSYLRVGPPLGSRAPPWTR